MSAVSFFKDDGPPSRPRTAEGGLQNSAMLKRPKLGSRNVSFEPGVQSSSAPKRPEHHRFNSDYGAPVSQQPRWSGESHVQRIDRHAQNVDPTLEPALPFTRESRDSPFAIYDDNFEHLLGQEPTLERILSDSRGPFFYSGGAYVSSLSTCFLTSDILHDPDPWAVASGNRRVELTKLEFHGANKVARDKVRCPERSYMAAGVAVHPSSEIPSIIVCTQGLLSEAAGLVSIEARRPHKPRMILNNFHGKPFNSPSEIVSNPVDNAVYFLDPAFGYERGFRPRPKLPSGHIYRFHPATGDCRVVASDLRRPAGLAFSPDYTSLYVSELIQGHDGVYIHAYDITYTESPKVPSFNISVVPSVRHAANGSTGSASGSSTQSSTQQRSLRSQPYATPDSSPQPRTASLLGRPPYPPRTSSRPRSGSHTRTHELSNHKFLHSMTNGLRSPSRGPTSDPESSPPLPTAFSSTTRKRGMFLSNKRLVVYTPNAVPSGAITTDPVHGDLWLGTEEGVEVWNAGTGELTGKIMVEEWDARFTVSGTDDHRSKMQGVSKVVFTSDSEALLLGGQRIWRLRMGLRGIQFP